MHTVVAPVSLLNTSKLRRMLSLGTPGLIISTSARTSARIRVGLTEQFGSAEIDRHNLAQWQSSRGLRERIAAGVDKAPTNEHTI